MRPRLPITALLLVRTTTTTTTTRHRLYSTTSTTTTKTTAHTAAAHAEPLIRITNLPAPSTGHIRVLELNRPRARNAISRDLLAALRGEVHAVRAQYGPDGEEVQEEEEEEVGEGRQGRRGGLGPTRAVVLASAVDACFCAGADLKERRGFTQAETSEFLSTLRETLTSLADLPIPTISAISSVALGGGLELALATHFRVLSSNAT
ncbi:hypothetical protein E4U41_007249, partial [Claviceps citrina]